MVGLDPTAERGTVRPGWFCAIDEQTPRLDATHGTPASVGTGPPET